MQVVPLEPGETLGAVTPPTPPPSLKIENIPLPVPEQKSTSTESKEPKIDEDTSPQDSVRIAALIRKEKQLLKRARELAAREAKISEVQSQYKPWQEAADLAKQNKLEAIRKLGISYDDLTQQVLNNGNLPPEVIAQQKASEIVKLELESYRQEQQKLQMENQRLQYQQALKNIDAEVQAFVNSSDKYPLVKNAEAYNDVTRFIESEFHKTGKVLTIAEATDKWHSEIKEGFVELAKSLPIEELRSLLASFEPPAPPPEVPNPPKSQPITTLTHKATTNAPTARPLTNQEKRQRAIDAFYGRLK